MKVRDLTELAARNLREALLRNSLTTLGIAVGVASLVAMLSLGVGLQELANKRLSSSGLFDAIFVGPHMNDRGFGRPRPASASASSSANNSPTSDARANGANSADRPPTEDRPLNEAARAEIAKVANVQEVYPEIRFNTEILYDGNPYMTMVAGIPDSARSGGAFDGMKGSFFSSPTADEAILQIDFAKQLSDNPDSLIGKTITLRYAEREPIAPQSNDAKSADPKSTNPKTDANETDLSPGFNVIPRQEKLRVIGIVTTEPAAGFGGFGRGRVLIPEIPAEKLSAAQQNDLRDILRGRTGEHTFASLTVRVKKPADVAAAEDAIKTMGFSTFSLLDATKNLRLVFAVFDALLGVFGSLALIVASLGIINTLVMAILERRREIGVLKALGASDRDVRKLFFAEAGAMGLLGGIFGVFIGWLIGTGMTFGTNVYLARQDLPAIQISSVPWWMVASAIAFSVAVSLAAGLYPASRASKLNPVEALRYE
jgi:putative ABC transport system permease protein